MGKETSETEVETSSLLAVVAAKSSSPNPNTPP